MNYSNVETVFNYTIDDPDTWSGNLNDVAKNILLWAVIAVILLSVFSNFSKPTGSQAPLSYSTFIQMVKSGEVAQVTVDGRDIKGKLGNGNMFSTYSPETDNRALVGDLLEHGVDIKGVPPEGQSVLMQIFIFARNAMNMELKKNANAEANQNS